MFRVIDDRGLTRRSFVQGGILGVGGLTLAELLAGRPSDAATNPSLARPANDTAVILFWLSGGPGHMETWDPKPEAPPQIRGPFGAIPTKVDGIRFGELLPRQAKIADRLAIVRSVNHG